MQAPLLQGFTCFVAVQCQQLAPYVASEMGHSKLRLFDAPEMEQMVKESVIQDPCTLVAYYRYVKDIKEK